MERYIRTSTAGIAQEVALLPSDVTLNTKRITVAFGLVCSAFTYDKDQGAVYDLLIALIRVTINTQWVSTAEAMEQTEVARLRAHAKHGDNSIEAKRGDDTVFWLACLGEEVGEFFEAETVEDMAAEALDIITVATAWAAALSRVE